MVNIPINVSTCSTDEIAELTDINQNINQEYYEWLLKQHNYFPEYAFHKEKFSDTIKMEHSYTRDWKPTSNRDGVMPTRTILVERPPPCPSCHQLPPNHDTKIDTPETYNIPIPPYNEEAGRHELNAIETMIKSCHNRNSDTEDWTQDIKKTNWTDQQHNLFECVERLLDMDQLGRLAVNGLPNECLRRHAIIQKSASRMRAALATVHWDTRLTSWLHGLLMTNLPANYMVSYIHILQMLKRKVPTLVDRMLYHRPNDMYKDYMSAIKTKPWQPVMVAKTRTIPSNPVIVMVSSCIGGKAHTNTTSREKRWMELLSTLTSVEMVTINLQTINPHKSIEQVTEQLIVMARAKIQEIRLQTPNRHIILVGFNAGAALALQIAYVESVNSVICLGFAYNTLYGVHGASDDRIIELTTPVLFVIGQNAQRSSQEEIASLRERMSAQTLLVVVGSSDDALRVKRLNRSMEGVSQTMIDSMIMDEIQEFATNCVLNPPGPRKLKHLNGQRKATKQRASPIPNGSAAKRMRLNGKHQSKSINGHAKLNASRKNKMKLNGIKNGNGYDTPSPLTNDSDDSMVQIEFDTEIPFTKIHDQNGAKNGKITTIPDSTNGSPILRQKVKFITSDKFVHIKPPQINTENIYVKQQPNGCQSYSLDETPLITVVQKEPVATASSSSDEEISELTSNTTDDVDKNLDSINIFDIPILFGDNDDNHNDTLTQRETSKPLNKVEILSEEIITDAIAGNDIIIDQQQWNGNATKGDPKMQNGQSTSPLSSPPLSRSGNFLLLNKNTLSQMKPIQLIKPAGKKIKKMIFQSRNSDATITPYSAPYPPSQKLPTVPVQKPRLMSVDPCIIPPFNRFKRLEPSNHIDEKPTNGRPKSPKSGIISRNHLKNFTIRRVNVIRSSNINDIKAISTKSINNNNNNNNNNIDKDGMIRKPVRISIQKKMIGNLDI